ncbi:MAG: NACHT domain-containing protein [Limnoraphis robusta]
MEQSRERDFLEAIAKQYGFTGTRKEVFLLRLDRQNEKLGNQDLINQIENLKNSNNPAQNFQDHLQSICQAFSDCENCPVVLEKKRGRQPKGEEPWRKVFAWLWDEKYPQWQPEAKINTPQSEINWHEICQQQATQRQKITTNSLTFKDGINHSREPLYVPLGLVERKKRERRTDELSPEKGSQMYAPETYEVTQAYAQKRFFEEVIQQGKSNSQGKRLAVIGEPGAGKSTLLQELEQWVLDRTDLIPVWVSLASLGEKTLEDYLLNNWLKEVLDLIQVTPEDIEALQQLFNNQKVFLLLDGVDEMSGRSQNVLGDIASQINGWLAPARVILTCRLNVWDGDKNALHAFDTYRTLEFSYPEQVHLFIENWFNPPQSLKGENFDPPQPPLKRQGCFKVGRKRVKK